MRKALILGRFQPFHFGHLHLINEALKYADKIIIAVGSSNVTDSNNPISYESRVSILKKMISVEGLSDKIERIVPSPDHPDDKIWLNKLLKRTGEFDISIGNNDWVNGILKKAGYKTIEIPLLKRASYKGTNIRKLIRNGKTWEKNVPEYLKSAITKKLLSRVS